MSAETVEKLKQPKRRPPHTNLMALGGQLLLHQIRQCRLLLHQIRHLLQQTPEGGVPFEDFFIENMETPLTGEEGLEFNTVIRLQLRLRLSAASSSCVAATSGCVAATSGRVVATSGRELLLAAVRLLLAADQSQIAIPNCPEIGQIVTINNAPQNCVGTASNIKYKNNDRPAPHPKMLTKIKNKSWGLAKLNFRLFKCSILYCGPQVHPISFVTLIFITKDFFFTQIEIIGLDQGYKVETAKLNR